MTNGAAAFSASVSRPHVPCLAGEWRLPHNDLQDQKVGGGHKAIHDDETAAKIGFGAAPIHGTVHWSQFTPLFLKTFGHAWFETGSISVHFMTPVSHLQPVRAFMAQPDPEKIAQQVDIWMEHMDGRVVFEGTASVGLKRGEMTTMAQSKMAKMKPIKSELLFVRHPVGTKSTTVEKAQIDFGRVIGPLFPFTLEQKLEIITEFHPWFTKVGGRQSPWGRPILPPESLNQIMLGLCGSDEPAQWPRIAQDERFAKEFGGRTPVGLFGGCEVIIHAGPVFVGETYNLTRELVGKGETPKAEFRWDRSVLTDQSGKVVAEMTLQSMMLKGSFDGYESLRKRMNAANSTSKL
eukprot:TRINITY_DN23806_c0_g2_i1.p1 TRINITY_DN23806_c0_g2~~TRINITY_DN23806_c0_g2_i1.p1  ORF type:complete len:368 (-),score=31.66 TRINITY_DN23806_c0_g2_i1:94-1140(-)